MADSGGDFEKPLTRSCRVNLDTENGALIGRDDPDPDNIDGLAAASGDNKKKRHRRNRKAGEHHQARGGKRQWKPYTEMTWDERRQKDEVEEKRANRRRDRRMASGQAMAPYNTTQFLMEQHEPETAPGEDPSGAAEERRLSGGSVTGESTGPDGADEEDEEMNALMFRSYMQFAEDYETARAERLQKMTKDELIRDLVDMESRLDAIQGPPNGAADTWNNELRRLRTENERLTLENDRLRKELANMTSTPGTMSAIGLVVSCAR